MAFNYDKYVEIQGVLRKFYTINNRFRPKLIVVSKNQPISSIIDAINHGVCMILQE